nr:hypothetical protein [uncultured bacterium]
MQYHEKIRSAVGRTGQCIFTNSAVFFYLSTVQNVGTVKNTDVIAEVHDDFAVINFKDPNHKATLVAVPLNLLVVFS